MSLPVHACDGPVRVHGPHDVIEGYARDHHCPGTTPELLAHLQDLADAGWDS